MAALRYRRAGRHILARGELSISGDAGNVPTAHARHDRQGD